MIGEDIIAFFASMGDIGMILALVTIIVIDGTGFPTLPEVWMVWIFGVHFESFTWALALIVIAGLASLCGNFLLYSIVRFVGMPHRIQKAMRKYTDFLIVSDERLLLLNRIAPLVPYTGAFMAVCKWDLKRCAVYLVTGAMAKAAVVVLLAWLSYDNLKEDLAPWIALVAVAVVLLASLVASVAYRRKMTPEEATT